MAVNEGAAFVAAGDGRREIHEAGAGRCGGGDGGGGGSRHLSDDLLISCILVDDPSGSGADIAAMVKSICPDSEAAPDTEVLERRLFRALEKRGPAAALEGWRLSTREEEEEKRRRRSAPEDAEDEEGRPRRGRSYSDVGASAAKDPGLGKSGEGSQMKRLYTPYQLRSVLQLMGLKQLRAHEVTRLAFEKLGQLCIALEGTWFPDALPVRAGPAGETREGHSPPTGSGSGSGSGGTGRSEQRTVSLKRRQFIMLLTLALAIADRCRKKHVQDFVMACAIREHRRGMIILFGGTSGIYQKCTCDHPR